MDWQKLSAPEFLKWLSLEGIDGMRLVNKDYENLPWSLRVALQFLTNLHNRFLELPSNWLYDNSTNFGHVLENWKNESQAHYTHANSLHIRAEIWMDETYFRQDSEQMVRLLEGDPNTLAEAEKRFREWEAQKLDYKEEPSYLAQKLEEKNIEALTEEDWDNAWIHGNTGEILEKAPIFMLDKWCNVSRQQRHQIMSRILSSPRISVPEHWINGLTSHNLDVDDLEGLLIRYLRRKDVPREVRKKFRRDVMTSVRTAAWTTGECSEEELKALSAFEWSFLSDREDINLSIAQGLLKHLPQSVIYWRESTELTREVRLLLVQAGHNINWAVERDAGILQLGVQYGNEVIWGNMGMSVQKHWGSQVCRGLVERLVELRNHSLWSIKRVMYMGQITPDRELLKAMLKSPSPEVRLYGAILVGEEGLKEQATKRISRGP